MMIQNCLKHVIPKPIKNILWKSYYFYLAHPGQYIKNISSITLEPTNVCDIQCEVCPVPKLKRKKGFLTLEDFKNIFDRLPLTIKFIRMNYAGDPLLNKQIFKMVKYAKNKRPEIKIRISTSGTQLKQFSPQEIIDSQLDELDICIDGPTKEVHESYRHGSNFEEICAAAQRLCQYKKEHKTTTPLLIQQSLLHKQNIPLMSQLEELAKKLGFDELHLRYMGIPTLTCPLDILQKLYPYYAGLSIEELNNFKDKYLPDLEYSIYKKQGDKYVLKKEMKKCYSFLSPLIYYNGDVSVCCHDGEGYSIFGNLLREDFQTIVSRMPVRDIYYKRLSICQDCDLSWMGINYKEVKIK